MSRLKRSKVRLDKAISLMEAVQHDAESHQPLHVESKLIRLLQDIPAEKWSRASNRDEWQTLIVVLRTAALAEFIEAEPQNITDNLLTYKSTQIDNLRRSIDNADLKSIATTLIGADNMFV